SGISSRAHFAGGAGRAMALVPCRRLRSIAGERAYARDAGTAWQRHGGGDAPHADPLADPTRAGHAGSPSGSVGAAIWLQLFSAEAAPPAHPLGQLLGTRHHLAESGAAVPVAGGLALPDVSRAGTHAPHESLGPFLALRGRVRAALPQSRCAIANGLEPCAIVAAGDCMSDTRDPSVSGRIDLTGEGVHWDLGTSQSYGDYLQLAQLLNAQKPVSAEHDELMFIIVHQVSELWIRLFLHELQLVQGCVVKD